MRAFLCLIFGVMFAGCGASGAGSSGSLPIGVPNAVDAANARRAGWSADAGEYRVVYRFMKANEHAGLHPHSTLTKVGAYLWGTAFYGGSPQCTDGCGTVFAIHESGNAPPETFGFTLASGVYPNNGLFYANGLLYGTTKAAGPSGGGTFFSLDPSNGAHTIITSFGPLPKPAGPDGPVSVDQLGRVWVPISNGNIPGQACGPDGNTAKGCGALYDATNGAYYSFVINTTYFFGSEPGGHMTTMTVLDQGHTYDILVGTARHYYDVNVSAGKPGLVWGTVVRRDGFQTRPRLRPLVAFKASAFSVPSGGLTSVGDTVYGAARDGGDAACKCGAIYAASPKANCGDPVDCTWNVRVLYEFKGGQDGAYPVGELLHHDGKLIGATQEGGGTCHGAVTGCGTIFSIDVARGAETILHRFKGFDDGAQPQAGPTLIDGTLYGTTSRGGSTECENELGCGTIYALAP